MVATTQSTLPSPVNACRRVLEKWQNTEVGDFGSGPPLHGIVPPPLTSYANLARLFKLAVPQILQVC